MDYSSSRVNQQECPSITSSPLPCAVFFDNLKAQNSCIVQVGDGGAVEMASSNRQASLQHQDTDRQETTEVCRVCHCSDSDKHGESALRALDISLPILAIHQKLTSNTDFLVESPDEEKETSNVDVSKDDPPIPSLEGELHTSSSDFLIELGCSCRNDLALAHYACALRWFVNRGSLVCEICGACAANVDVADRDKVVTFLKERELALVQHATARTSGEVVSVPDNQTVIHTMSISGRESPSEVLSWFSPHGTSVPGLLRSASEQVINVPDEGILNSVSPATKWAVEGTGILIATGLLTVTITWLIAPRVNKGIAKRGLTVLLGGLCALSIVVFLRFGVLPRIKYGPARYWAILVVFWFLVFGVWASSTRNTRTST